MDNSPLQNEKISIKNLLFYKAIPNYKLPVSADGHPTFACKDCGDKYLIQSSYEYHINRKSLKITYNCRHCNTEQIFYNRCNLLAHIRSHVFKTATINISDLKIEPLPLSFFKFPTETITEVEVPLEVPVSLPAPSPKTHEELEYQQQTSHTAFCYECKENIYSTGILSRDRANHYSHYTCALYSCPICLVTLPTQCALKAHIRLHLQEPPYYCPECGIHLSQNTLVYPYSHDCESFKMMRVTAKLKCMLKLCSHIFHPNEILKHLKINHLKKVYKCSACSVACYKMCNMQKHMKTHTIKVKILEFFQCEICPGRLVIPGQIEKHLKSHADNVVQDVYPCWRCGTIFHSAKTLVIHQTNKHQDKELRQIFGNSLEGSSTESQNIPTKSLVINKKCNNCFKFLPRYPSTDMSYLPNELQCKCADLPKIICHLCKTSIDQNWSRIKRHYATCHKEHKCLDVIVVLKKIIIDQTKKRGIKKRRIVSHQSKNCRAFNTEVTRNSNPDTSTINFLICNKCGEKYENKKMFEKHIVIHKDPFMAYQCMECAESFAAKPSFSTHLLLKHGLENVNDYINEKKCYWEESLHMNVQNREFEDNRPLKENQCNICREQFANSTDFEKHFRVHGMAFLMKNTNKVTSPDKT